MILERSERSGTETTRETAVFNGEPAEKKTRQCNRVSGSLPQWRNLHCNLVQPIVQILPKAPLSYHQVEVLVRRTHDPHIDLHWIAPADPLDDLILQKAQQFHLHRQRHVADLVQEQGPAIGAFDSADRLLERSSERALFVTEELAFEKRLRDRRTIDWHKRLARTGTQFVDCPGEQLLAGAALAAQQYCNVGGCHLLDVAQHP